MSRERETAGSRFAARLGSEGFTLTELLVVLALIGLISLFALPSVNSFFKLSLNSTTRELASVVKETYNSTMMTGKVHRIVYDFKNNEFWAEVGPSTFLLDTEATREEEERRRRFARAGEEKPKSPFALAESVTRKKKELPRGVVFEDVVTEQSPEPITEGEAYTHFFPHGISEKSIIHLKDTQNHQITLVISPLVGRVQVLNGYVTEEELYADR